MGPISKAIHKQALLLLDNKNYGYLVTALLAALPFMTWLSVTIMALITLRKSSQVGFNTMVCGFLGLLLATSLTASVNLSTVVVIVLTFVPCYITALLLRISAKWDWVMLFMIVLASFIILLLNHFTPAFLVAEYHALQNMLKELQQNDVQLLGFLGSPTQIMAYLLGIQAMTFMISIISTLLLARAIQSKIFYPGGFKKEMLSFEANAFMLLPFFLILYGLYHHSPLAISLLPSWTLYFVCAGLSVIVAQFANNKPALILGLLLIPMILLPFIMLPTIAGIGIIDSFFHFRRRFGKQNANHP